MDEFVQAQIEVKSCCFNIPLIMWICGFLEMNFLQIQVFSEECEPILWQNEMFLLSGRGNLIVVTMNLDRNILHISENQRSTDKTI